jgi:hypothetical protein
MPVSASRTSSSLNGLITAMTIFMADLPGAPDDVQKHIAGGVN